MKIAMFNVNGINGRLERLLEWLHETSPDIACLQELKTVNAKFPGAALRRAGYRAVWTGEKARNGVAILAKNGEPVLTRTALPGDPSDQECRYVEAAVEGVLI